MPLHFHVRAAEQALAVYTDASATGNVDVLANPGAHLSAIKLHSSLNYPKIIGVQSGTTTMPAVAANTRRLVTSTLFAHGRPGIPWVLAKATIGGVMVPVCGTLVLQKDSVGRFLRTIAFGADATNVLLHENGLAHNLGTVAAITIAWTVYVTDVLP